ncbi:MULTISPECIES: hypothetical protein [unclassified Vibrio]|uniref:hypothetical protein n=1 Tax=unclassified Vibrio TaxID=2614977 RepID=UPI000C84C29C|nr:hypothetical protein [Vibrio sp. 10N.261.54.E10]PMK06636.1 hypothetical protein BCU07_04115 [Vibrio sp. 10N.261.54.E10]
MNKIKIKIVSLGALPATFDRTVFDNFSSNIFSIEGRVESYEFRADSDLDDWGYSDVLLSTIVPKKRSTDFLVVLTSVPLEDNYYTRRIGDNTIVFTFHEVGGFLKFENIPLENVVKRLLYAYSLVYLRNGELIPHSAEIINFTHDDTRGCIFDMNGIKEDITHSCHDPKLCSDCSERLVQGTVSIDTINQTKKELKKIRKTQFYILADWVKVNPKLSIVISSVWAISLGVIGSLIATALSSSA